MSPNFRPSRSWRSLTPFVPVRHAKSIRTGVAKLDPANGLQIGSREHDCLRLPTSSNPICRQPKSASPAPASKLACATSPAPISNGTVGMAEARAEITAATHSNLSSKSRRLFLLTSATPPASASAFSRRFPREHSHAILLAASPLVRGSFHPMSRQWIWVQSDTPPKCKLGPWEKRSLVGQAESFIQTFYRPTFVKPPTKNGQFNYAVDFSARWHGSCLLFTAKYACPGPDALTPFFEHNFARLGYFDRDRYNLWVRRHNDQWLVIARDLTLDACFAEMRTNPWFHF